MRWLPAWLAALGALLFTMMLHYGMYPFPPSYRALAWNILGSIGRLELLALVFLLLGMTRADVRRYALAMVAVAWLVAEEAMVIGCNAAYIVSPWAVPEGEDMCSNLLRFDLAKLGGAVGAVLLFLILRRRHP
jgi:hypothetical protein